MGQGTHLDDNGRWRDDGGHFGTAPPVDEQSPGDIERQWPEAWADWEDKLGFDPTENLEMFSLYLDLQYEALVDGEISSMEALEAFIEFCIANDIDVHEALEALYDG